MEQDKQIPCNLIGPQLAKIRTEKELTQEQLAAKCQVAGLDISRSTLAKIEAQIRCATDFEILTLSKVLKVHMTELFPKG